MWDKICKLFNNVGKVIDWINRGHFIMLLAGSSIVSLSIAWFLKFLPYLFISLAIIFGLLGTFGFIKSIIHDVDKIIPKFLFTASKPVASILDIAIELGKFHNLLKEKILSLLLSGYWRGYFEENKTKGPVRLKVLKSFHDIDALSDNFIFAYEHESRPKTVQDLPDGGCEVDIRPVLPVPDKNTNNWTNQNCQKAFQVLASQPESYNEDDIWPEYIPNDAKPVFCAIKITKESLVSFLKKEKVI